LYVLLPLVKQQVAAVQRVAPRFEMALPAGQLSLHEDEQQAQDDERRCLNDDRQPVRGRSERRHDQLRRLEQHDQGSGSDHALAPVRGAAAVRRFHSVTVPAARSASASDSMAVFLSTKRDRSARAAVSASIASWYSRSARASVADRLLRVHSGSRSLLGQLAKTEPAASRTPWRRVYICCAWRRSRS